MGGNYFFEIHFSQFIRMKQSSHLKKPKSEEMKYLNNAQKNKLQKVMNSILELEQLIRESQDRETRETKIRKDFRELKERKIKIRKELEDLLLNP